MKPYQYRGKLRDVSAPEATPVVKELKVPKPRRDKIPGRKRGPGRNNKHGSGCGTNNGWAAHNRQGTVACDPCVAAHREYVNACERASRARKAA